MKRRSIPLSIETIAPQNAALAHLDFVAPQSAVLADAGTGNWMLLVPKGKLTGRDGRGPYDAGDAAAMQAVIDTTRARSGSTDLMVDYDHQAVFAAVPGVGGQAKAAGWVTDYRVTDAGIEGHVEWTDAASAAIRAREYRYLSPVFRHDQSGRVLSLHSVGLVNTPNFDLEAVAASQSLSEGASMLKEIAKALGLAETASEEAILVAVNAAQAERAKIAEALGLKADAAGADVVLAVQSAGKGGVDPKLYVPIAQVTAMQASLKALQDGAADRDAAEAVEAAIKGGKLAPALREWGLSVHKSDPAHFRTFVDKSPVLTEPQLGHGRAPASTAEPEIGATDLAVMRQMGLDPKDYAETAKAMAGGAR